MSSTLKRDGARVFEEKKKNLVLGYLEQNCTKWAHNFEVFQALLKISTQNFSDFFHKVTAT